MCQMTVVEVAAALAAAGCWRPFAPPLVEQSDLIASLCATTCASVGVAACTGMRGRHMHARHCRPQSRHLRQCHPSSRPPRESPQWPQWNSYAPQLPARQSQARSCSTYHQAMCSHSVVRRSQSRTSISPLPPDATARRSTHSEALASSTSKMARDLKLHGLRLASGHSFLHGGAIQTSKDVN
eukprot:2769298-Prymnesium_polylepis.1